MNTVTRIFSILVLLIAVVACGPQQAKKAPDEVTLQLKWVHQAQFAGFYVAQEKGYYAKENIKVNFLEGGQGIDIAGAVISGKADFAVVAPEDVLIKRSQGTPLTAIAAIYRRSAVVYLSMANSGIIRPADLLGKKVAAAGTAGAIRDFEFQFYGLIKKLGLNSKKLKIVTYDPDYVAFYKGEVDVTAAFATGDLIKMRQKGLQLNLIWPSDYGIHFYSDTLATTDRMIVENPELVSRFLRASLRGWQDAIEDYRQAVTVTLKYSQIKDPELQTAMMEAMLPLVQPVRIR